MKNIFSLARNFSIIWILSTTSFQAFGYDEYLKELEELKKFSETTIKNSKTRKSFKNEYNELARYVNKYIDYFIQIADGRASFNFSEIENIIHSINKKIRDLNNRIIEVDKKTSIMNFSTPLVIASTLKITLLAVHEAYELFKEMKDDYEKHQIKEKLKSYKWKKLE
jgi:hypothetical protein